MNEVEVGRKVKVRFSRGEEDTTVEVTTSKYNLKLYSH
jgi:hypothetical protein